MKICLVCSHGGHYTEMLQIISAFQDHEFFFATYHSSREKEIRKIAPAYFTHNIGMNPLRLFFSIFWALFIILREKPKVIISLGAEIALPFFYLARFLDIRTIFIESWCRVENLSKTGKLLLPISDEFWVQWPQLLNVCSQKARYMGAVI